MKNKIFVMLVTTLFALSGTSFAIVKGEGVQTQVQTQSEVQTQNSGGEVQVQVESQNQVQNQSEVGDNNATGTQVQTNQENQIKSGNEIKSANDVESSSTDNGTSSEDQVEKTEPEKIAEQSRNEVADAVQQMLQVADRVGGIGQEIKVVAQAQNENQVKIQDSINKIESRSGLVKFIAGPNYGEINNAQNVLNQNKEQITQLNQIKSQIANQSDQQKLAEQISILEQSNVKLEAALNQSGQGFSLLGWLFKMFQ